MKNSTVQKLGITSLLIAIFSTACIFILPNKQAWAIILIISFAVFLICSYIHKKRLSLVSHGKFSKLRDQK